MAPRNYRASDTSPPPEVTITKALRIGAEELSCRLKNGYQSYCNKLNCCHTTSNDGEDQDERQRLIQKPRKKYVVHHYNYGVPRNQKSSAKSTKSQHSSLKDSHKSEYSSTVTSSSINRSRPDEEEDEDEVPADLRSASPKTPPTPPSWKNSAQKLKLDTALKADGGNRVQVRAECWPSSCPGLQRSEFGSRFYSSS